MKKKNNFNKVFPILDNYINNESLKENMLINEEFINKYKNNEFLIKTYIYEMNKYFDNNEIENFLIEVIYKLPDNIFRSFVIAYLNSNEDAKANKDVLKYYKKILEFGINEITYIEKNGIVTNSKYKRIPYLVLEKKVRDQILILDQEYENIRLLNEKYKDEELEDIYYGLNINEKEFVNELLKEKSFNYLNIIFEKFNISLKLLLNLLTNNKIDINFFKEDFINQVGEYELMILICTLINSKNINLINKYKILIINDKINLIKDVIKNDYILDIDNINDFNLEDEEILNILRKVQKSKTKEAF